MKLATAIRVLFATPLYPWPIDSGIRMRMDLALRVLSEIGDVTLLSLGPKPRGAGSNRLRASVKVAFVPDDLRMQFSVQAQRGAMIRWRALMRHLWDPRPVRTRILDSEALHETLLALGITQFDLVWIQGLALYGQLRRYKLRHVITDFPDVEFFNARRELRMAPTGRGLLFGVLDLVKLWNAERHWEGEGHWAVVCSERDAGLLRRWRKRVWVVRNAVDLPSTIHPMLKASAETLLFVGTFLHKPNIEAVHYFVSKIFPLILQSRPSVRLQLVGSDPPAEIRALERHSQIFVAGSVESVGPFLRDASVVVVPLLSGAGTRLKILEAMSHRKAVVSTSVGAEGLAIEHGREILLADLPSEFASFCVELLTNDGRRRQLGECGWRFVCEHHRTELAEQDLRSLLATVLPPR